MKIRIEPSQGDQYETRTVEVDSNSSCEPVPDAVELALAALTAWGYARQSVLEAMSEVSEELEHE